MISDELPRQDPREIICGLADCSHVVGIVEGDQRALIEKGQATQEIHSGPRMRMRAVDVDEIKSPIEGAHGVAHDPCPALVAGQELRKRLVYDGPDGFRPVVIDGLRQVQAEQFGAERLRAVQHGRRAFTS
ncbi:hypothetical protein D3C80_1309210 [compost metagenome]